ncbi:MAG: transglycosylase SLT domain-containing protein [Chloroflexota bacterium]|nr:transglycosylase SLT domain-containing protein [Chloroflexota bacterium]
MSQSAPVPVRPSFARRSLTLVLAALMVASVLGVASVQQVDAGGASQRDQQRFMWAMAGQESGWDYYARNVSSGAFGKYQIMPFNWPVWAGQYLGDARADQTPYNQEKVASGKLRDLYRWLGSWKRVAYWWLTGRTDKNEKKWSSYAKGYVDNIMRLRKKAPSGGSAMPPRTGSRSSKGDWRRSGSDQKFRLTVGGRAWPGRGRIRDGQVLKVKAVKVTRKGERWIEVVTADGRLGWLKQSRTVPARKPASPGRWSDVKDDGAKKRRSDRKQVRPRPH